MSWRISSTYAFKMKFNLTIIWKYFIDTITFSMHYCFELADIAICYFISYINFEICSLCHTNWGRCCDNIENVIVSIKYFQMIVRLNFILIIKVKLKFRPLFLNLAELYMFIWIILMVPVTAVNLNWNFHIKIKSY